MLDPGSGSPESVTVGWTMGLHRRAGAVRVKVYSDVPGRFDTGQSVRIGDTVYIIESTTTTRAAELVLKLQGLDTPEAARNLIGQLVTIPKEASPQLPQGEYFHFQLVDLRVVTEEGEELGRVKEVLQTGSNDVYVVSGAGGEILLPAIREVVREVDPARGRMVVKLMEGLR